ncbi:Allatostatin-A receptor [Fasciola hepatica]|uniref:Allatostatin-A receptor n=1 Tax=Fasciola hepatica TaxID=6192 RepID=A0A2H1CT48_FASHE|nr:Allatostatin-A receptor [Fasciola hepatica]
MRSKPQIAWITLFILFRSVHIKAGYETHRLYEVNVSATRTGVEISTAETVPLPTRANQSIPACILDVNLTENVNVLTVFTRWVTPILFGLFLIVGSVGNLLVIIVVLVNAQMRDSTNILILSLAVADLAFIVICIPLTTVIYIVGGWPMGVALCKVYFYLMYVTAFCSVYTLVLMSLDRFLAVVYPMRSIQWRNQANTVRIVLFTWSVVLIANLPLLINAVIVRGPVDGGDSACYTEYCTYAWLVTVDEKTQTARDNYDKARPFFLIFFLFGYLLPFVGICILYISLICRLRCRRSPNIKQSAESRRSKKRVTVLVVTVVVVFGISWLPIHIVFLIQYFVGDPNTDFFRIVQILSNSLAYGNSSINPILYAFLSVNFRKAFIDLFQGRRKQTHVANGSPHLLDGTRLLSSQITATGNDVNIAPTQSTMHN